MVRPAWRIVAVSLILLAASVAAVAVLVIGDDGARLRSAGAGAGPDASDRGGAAPSRATGPAPSSATAPYTVTMSPMGAVTFPRVPRRIVTLDANSNDMLAALGVAGGLVATGYRNNFYDGFYREIPGFAAGLDPARLTFLARAGGGFFDKELLYALRPDVFHIDPRQLAAARGWSAADVDEVARNVAPFFANRYSRDDSYPGKDPYAYYTVMELAAKLAEVYQRPQRIARLAGLRDRLVAAIAARLPPAAQRPRIGLVFYANGKFTPYSLAHGGFGQAQYRDVGARDAFASIAAHTYGAGGGGGESAANLDLEGLLALDPDVLIVPFAIYPGSAGTTRGAYEALLALNNDPLGGRLAAFRHGRVYPGGTPLQGPLFYIFQIEMAAKQIYPEIFGAYRDDQQYPASERLFDRDEVAAILADRAWPP